MAASITHRVTGMALAGGTLFLAWWLIAAASGPDAYAVFAGVAAHPVGVVIMFGLLWSLTFHLLNGVRHLAWDLGYGFKMSTSRLTAALVYAASRHRGRRVCLAGGPGRSRPMKNTRLRTPLHRVEGMGSARRAPIISGTSG